MAVNISDYKLKLEYLLKEASTVLTEEEKTACIDEAVTNYSKKFPYVKIHAMTGDGSYQYSLPTDWSEGFSDIIEIEYPTGDRPPSIIDDSEWFIYHGASAKKIYFTNYSPTTAETANVQYTVAHAVGSTSSTIPAGDKDAVCNLAGALACYMLARKYALEIEPTIGADSVNHLSKSDIYAKRGKELEELYKADMGIGKKEDTAVPPASLTSDWDTDAAWGTDRLTHPKRYR